MISFQYYFSPIKRKLGLPVALLLIGIIGSFYPSSHVQAQRLQSQVNWPAFMHTSDLIFDTLTTSWTDGLFMGNGLLGNTIFMADANTLRMDVGRTDVRDHRKDTALGPLFSKARLPIGYFTLQPKGKLQKVTARLDIWDATGKGKLITDKGVIEWRSWTQTDKDVIIFQMTANGEEKEAVWDFHPAVSESPRIAFHPELKTKYKANPSPETGVLAGNNYCMQPLTAGGAYTTVWHLRIQKGVDRSFGSTAGRPGLLTRTYFISIGNNQKDKRSSLLEAGKNIKGAMAAGTKALMERHTSWWHDYFQKSFISVPDPVLNSFYWIQMYKLASASRKNKPLIDLMGPWMASTPWPGNWWNLNTELTYSPLYTANHLDIASVLGETISKNADNLNRNVPVEFRYNADALGRASGPDMSAPLQVTGAASDKKNADGNMELGDLTWNLYYYWLAYRYSMDTAVLTRLYPILKRNINYYLHLAKQGADGYYHLPYTYSPEYPEEMTRDANYALSLVRWGCQTLLEASKILGIHDPLTAKWQLMLAKLTPYPRDSNGLMIGRDVPFAKSHRHYSHLLMIYPLHLLTWSSSADKALIAKSLKHWHSLPGALQGYSFTGGASIYALMGEGDKALAYLKTLVHRYIKANTMYTESGPVIETPLAAATSLQELLLQSWNGIIRVFPAAPDKWPDISFDHLRTEGGFLVSAVRRDRITRWVKIKATVDGVCLVQPALPPDKAVLLKHIAGNLTVNYLKKVGPEKEAVPNQPTYQITMHKGEELVLYTDPEDLHIALDAVPFKKGDPINFFGKKLN